MPKALFLIIALRNGFALVVSLLTLTGALSARAESAPGSWGAQFKLPPGLNGPVFAMLSYGNVVVVGGGFTMAGNIQTRGLAMWDGTKWSEFGGGIDGSVSALAKGPGGLYVGGSFNHAGNVAATNIARWNGLRWESVGGGVNNDYAGARVTTLYVQNNRVYVGGSFFTAGGIPASNIAEWDGRMWHAMGGGVHLTPDPFPTGFVNSITGDGFNIYVGGLFLHAGNVAAKGLALWNGYGWRAIGNTDGGVVSYVANGEPESGSVGRLAVHQGELYVAGDFSRIGGLAITNLAKWDGRSWHGIANFNGGVSLLQSEAGSLYVAGKFDHIGGASAKNLAVLCNGQWSGRRAETPPREAIQALAFVGNCLYAGGDFGVFNGMSAGFIVGSDLKGWKTLGRGRGNSLDGSVSTLATIGTDLYAEGFFWTAGTKAVRGFAKWDGTTWSTLPGQIVNGGRFAVTGGTNLYYAGGIVLPTGESLGLGHWNGLEWTSPGGLHDGYIGKVVASGDKLYLNGSFKDYSGTAFTNISVWDGTNWAQLVMHAEGSYLYEELLGADDAYVYVVQHSYFWNNPPSVARWDGMNLEYLGESFTNSLQFATFVSSGTNLFLGVNPNGNHGATVYSWNGTSWQSLGLSAGDSVYLRSMAISEQGLYVGLSSFGSGTAPFNNIAQWNGSRWRSLGTGVTKGAYFYTSVDAIAVSGNKVCVGGYFTRAGGKESGNIGVWTEAER